MALLLTACGNKSPHNYNPEEKITQYSRKGEVKEVLSGDSIIHYQAEIIADTLVVPQNLVSADGIMVPLLIPAGVYVKTGETEKKIFFSRKSVRGYVAKAEGSSVTDIVYDKSSQKLTLNVAGEIILRSWDSGFSIKNNARIKVENDDVKMRSLNYNGSHGKLLSFKYKEGKNVQRITHNMDEGNIFTYQGAEVEIIKYDSKVLTCRVIKEFDMFR